MNRLAPVRMKVPTEDKKKLTENLIIFNSNSNKTILKFFDEEDLSFNFFS